MENFQRMMECGRVAQYTQLLLLSPGCPRHDVSSVAAGNARPLCGTWHVVQGDTVWGANMLLILAALFQSTDESGSG